MHSYIVGTGTFAEKLAATLSCYQLPVIAFVDEFREEPFLQRPVYKAANIPTEQLDELFFVAISNPVYAQQAKQRLINQGKAAQRIIILYYDSCAVLLAQMFKENLSKTLAFIDQCEGEFIKLERLFYERKAPLGDSEQAQISFRMLSRGGNYYSHLATLPKLLGKNYAIETCSDEVISQAEYTDLCSQQRMIATESDMVITPQLFICSPAQTTKITLTHAIYDSVMFRDTIIETLAQPDNHYIAIPSLASFEQHKQFCIEHQLTNNIVLMPIGYPKFDLNLQRYQEAVKGVRADAILYAPTQSATRKTGAQAAYSVDFALAALQQVAKVFPDSTIIFRPHPDDLKLVESGLQSQEVDTLKSIIEFVEQLAKGEVDRNISPMSSYCRAKVLISDTSSTAFTFAFTTLKPVIFFSPQEQLLPKDWSDTCFFKDRTQIGSIVTSSTELLASLDKADTAQEQKMRLRLREQQLFNLGGSELALQQAILSIEQGKKFPGAWYAQEHQQ